MNRNLVLFDFDGVIADSFAIAYAVARKACVRFDDASYRKSFEGNVHDWWENEFATQMHDPPCDHDLDWFAEYVPRFEHSARPFRGIGTVIGALSKEYVLIVISSTITSPIQGFLEKYHLGRYFAEVMGSDLHTKKTEKIKMVFEKYGVRAPRCVFVTDSLGDMKEASETGVGSIGTTWGWHARETLARGNPFRIVDLPREIPVAVSDYFAR